MSEESDALLAAMQLRHEAGEEFARLRARLGEFTELDRVQAGRARELLRIATRLTKLLEEERELNLRLCAFAMGLAEAGVISNWELNMLMGLV